MSKETDRELLELAAKAARIVVKRSRLDDPAMKDLLIEANREAHSTYIGWNPLTDDGDALRLAVKVGINIYLAEDGFVTTGRAGIIGFREESNDSPMFAARIAVVRAAAEIGKSLGDK